MCQGVHRLDVRRVSDYSRCQLSRSNRRVVKMCKFNHLGVTGDLEYDVQGDLPKPRTSGLQDSAGPVGNLKFREDVRSIVANGLGAQ
jgi:hypothetical protein